MLLYTYATQRPIGTPARSLHVGTPAHVYTVPTAGPPTYVRIGRYATVRARAGYTWAHPATCAPYPAVRFLTSARVPVVILQDTCINNILKRHGLRTSSVQVVEDKRLLAITPSTVTEHIARVQAALDRYNIRDARCIFNVDQSGSLFARMVGRSLRKGIGKPGQTLEQSNVRTKGQLDRVTIMPVVSAAGSTFKPVIVYPGKNPHYRKVRGHWQDFTAVLPECYLFYREVPGVD